jgi:RNA polymerase sigma factor (sigma-70 family)
MALSDNEIIESIRRGDKRQYARLIDRYKDKAMTLSVRMLRNYEDAEEAAQDAFVRAFKALDRFEGTAKFGTWLYRIVYNVCLTKIAKRKIEMHAEMYDDALSYEHMGVSSLPAFEHEIELKDMVRIMQKNIEQLPEKYATILSLFYFQELSHVEICEVTDLPLGTVKVHLYRARALLHERLSKEFSMENIPV